MTFCAGRACYVGTGNDDIQTMMLRLTVIFAITASCWGVLPVSRCVAQYSVPDSVRFVTSDIVNFWDAFDRAKPRFDSTFFRSAYLDKASDGLQDFVTARIGNAEKLAAAVRAHPRYYESIRPSTERISELTDSMFATFIELESIYPEAVFPHVYFLVGRLNSGGTASNRGLLIGAEMYGMTETTPRKELGDWHLQVLKPVETIPHIVAHEPIHYQQIPIEGKPTLLAASIKEGSADFIAEMISGDHINRHVHVWANERESDLWNEFQSKMLGNDYSGWLYGGSNETDRPADLGYWMGHQISRSYYEHAGDKGQAVADILQVSDFEGFLHQSGYPQRFE